MLEYDPISDGKRCFGRDRQFHPGVEIRILVSPEGLRSRCPVRDAIARTCGETEKTCVWDLFVSSPERDLTDQIVQCRTQLGLFALDVPARQMLQSAHLPEGHDPVHLAPKEAQLIEMLMRRQGTVVTREELEASLDISNLRGKSSLYTHLLNARHAIGATPETTQHSIQTIIGRGLRFAPSPQTT